MLNNRPDKGNPHNTTPTGFMIRTCPTCGEVTPFSLAGIQRWPVAIARKAGLPEKQRLFNCGSCGTTVTEESL